MKEKDDAAECVSPGGEIALGEAAIGSSGTIVRVRGEGKLRRRLFDMGLTPGADLYLRKRAPLGDPLEITIRGYELTLRRSEAMNVLVRISAKESENGK
ncbi:MAG: ferrous iron transport protein A [Bacilli bacterium]|jgi:Fe2+ transport system protein FeoA|nr:ferrous iron transport protein A [Bacilli bacterium]